MLREGRETGREKGLYYEKKKTRTPLRFSPTVSAKKKARQTFSKEKGGEGKLTLLVVGKEEEGGRRRPLVLRKEKKEGRRENLMTSRAPSTG